MPMMVGMEMRMVAVMSSDDHKSAQRVLYVIASSTVKLARRSTIAIIRTFVCVLRGIARYTSNRVQAEQHAPRYPIRERHKQADGGGPTLRF